MQTSKRGHKLPESFEEFQQLKASGDCRFLECIDPDCRKEFSAENTHTPAGWRETQISGICEDTFDELFEPGS